MKSLALLFVLGLLPPLHGANIVPDPFPPARFTSLYMERDEGHESTVIQLSGDAVTYTKTVGGKVVENATAHPSGDDWFKFIQGLNTAKVYKWAPKYYYPGQGASWVIDVAMENRRLSSSGTNEFPKENAEDQPQADPKAGPSVPFQFLWQAALELAGKKPAAPAK
jgi:hypothetical protein